MPRATPFLYMTCQPGAERLLKADLARREPQLRFAFSRPGFVTFKHERGALMPPPFARPSPFARSFGACLGPLERLDQPLEALLAALVSEHPDLKVQAFARDDAALGEEPPGALTPWERDAALHESLLARWPELGARLVEGSSPGEVVLDLVEVDQGKLWVGLHVHGADHVGTPAERPPHWSPPEALPSRVWFKLSEAMWRSGVALGEGAHVLDIGCAPGGGTLAMLERGARVLGVDPAKMHPEVLEHPRFTHLERPFEALPASELPNDLDWFVYDVNLSPMMMLKSLRKLLASLPSLRGGFVTLKLNREAHVEQLDWMLRQLELAGFSTITAQQLFYNRQELCAIVRR